MKAALFPRDALPRLRRGWQGLRRSPALSGVLTAALWAGAPLLLSAAALGGRPLPLAACFLLCAASWQTAAAAALGAAAGYALVWGWAGALEMLALCLLFVFARLIFRKTPVSMPLLGAGLTAAVGAVFLLDTGFSAFYLTHYLSRVGMAWIAPQVVSAALTEKKPRAGLILAGLGLMSLAGFLAPVGLCIGCGAALVLSAAFPAGELLPGLLAGLALDLGAELGGQMTGAMALAGLARLIPGTDKPLRKSLVCFAAAVMWPLFFGALRWPTVIGFALGAVGILLLPETAGRSLPAGRPQASAEEPLRRTARVMASMYELLSRDPGTVRGEELAEVYDFAAAQVCKCCVRSAVCWEQEAEQTYLDLCQAGKAILHRGSAVREDFPERFSGSCRHMEGFLTAVNGKLDECLCRKRDARRLQESRSVAAGNYLFISRLLGRLADLETAPAEVIRFTAELAVGTAARRGSEVSGDRGATCRDRWGHFYVLLCDGMGTGPEARAESDRAARMLTGFLEAGIPPDEAMAQLNGFYVLRQGSVFSTVDLVMLSLTTGEGRLYKWGAAPSYLLRGEEVEKIGTASPPPGCGVGSAHAAEQYPLSLKEGETLFLVSDGAFGEETEKRIAELRSGTVRDLAGCLIAMGENGDDDRTVAVLRLRSVGSG